MMGYCLISMMKNIISQEDMTEKFISHQVSKFWHAFNAMVPVKIPDEFIE